MLNITVALPGVHMAGTDAHYNAHIEVGQHGFALFLAPDAEYPVLDINGTSEQLNVVVQSLQAALASRSDVNAMPITRGISKSVDASLAEAIAAVSELLHQSESKPEVGPTSIGGSSS
jgi:hypothetical protein